MFRRDFISLLVGALVAGSRAIAQTQSKVYRVGTLLPGPPVDEKSPLGAILLQKLEQHGYTLGKNLAFEARGAGGQLSKLGEIVRSMKADQVDVIVAGGFPTTLACKVANVPTVVFLGVGDPVATHLIDSLAHPGGNITGISDNAAALATKRLELIKQAVPKGRRVAMLWNRNDLGMDRDPPDAIFMVADVLTTLNRKRMFDYAGAHHIPALYEYDVPNVHDGGLMSYGPDLNESMERAAGLTARIFGGARPADLPFEEPTHYKLVVNLKTAKATSIELPVNFLALADEVIE